jgi:hypothetical protein
MIRKRNTIIAITRRMWMNDPKTWNPKNPTSHKIISTVAIVVSIYFV